MPPARHPNAAQHIRKFVPGEIIVREGDPSDSMYVVLEGKVRVYKEPKEPDGSMQELARLGKGALIGEVAAVLGGKRGATVQAVTPVELLEISQGSLGSVVQSNAALGKVLTANLTERTDVSAEQIAALAADNGITLPMQAPAKPADDSNFPKPDHDAEYAYLKEVKCPACRTTFSAPMLRVSKDKPLNRNTDFHQVYANGQNPYLYEVWVCPSDLYAAFSQDFHDLNTNHVALVPKTVAEVVATQWDGERPDFNTARTPDLRRKALQLALAHYKTRKAPVLRTGVILHRLAWVDREENNAEAEMELLRAALHAYASAYQDTDLGSEKTELRVVYLCGELSLRIGQYGEAINWFWKVLQHPATKKHSIWDQWARERWEEARRLHKLEQSASAEDARAA